MILTGGALGLDHGLDDVCTSADSSKSEHLRKGNCFEGSFYHEDTWKIKESIHFEERSTEEKAGRTNGNWLRPRRHGKAFTAQSTTDYEAVFCSRVLSRENERGLRAHAVHPLRFGR